MDHPPAPAGLFAGSVPEMYQRMLVPLIFEPAAADLVERLPAPPLRRVLELAAGTGVLTRHLAQRLPEGGDIVATDLNAPMLAVAQHLGTARPVRWQVADALHLPFDAASFDLVVCQFGVMFFGDRPAGYAEVRRVLCPGGTWLFNTWDALAHNEFPATVMQALRPLYANNAPDFMERLPHGYHDAAQIRADLAAAGFSAPAQVETVAWRSRAATPEAVAIAFCQGTPMRGEIESRGSPTLDEATAAATQALAARFGPGPVEGKIQALIVKVSA